MSLRRDGPEHIPAVPHEFPRTWRLAPGRGGSAGGRCGGSCPETRRPCVPLGWFLWGEEAFAEARGRDVPLLISVGCSACHWCQ
ncbi:DUF255 domain-containing protein [Microbispora bryophytorum]